jgi:hypothetical protein
VRADRAGIEIDCLAVLFDGVGIVALGQEGVAFGLEPVDRREIVRDGWSGDGRLLAGGSQDERRRQQDDPSLD